MIAAAFWRKAPALLALALLAGCSGGGGVNSTPAPAPAPTPAPSPTPTPTPTPSPPPSFITSEYNRSDGPGFHKAIPAWQSGATGTGVTIGIVDSGIDTNSPEFAGRISPSSIDVVGSRGLNNADSDHGTNVAMIAAAARDNTGIVGIAWNATIAMFRADTVGSCANPDPTKGCTFNDNAIATGIDRAVTAGAKVINLSLGGSPPNANLRAAISRASAAGAVIVVSAGNDGDSTDPAVDPNNPDPLASGAVAAGNGNVIIAGSVSDQGVFSAFSNRAGRDQLWFLSALGERVCCVYENGVLKITTDANGVRSQFVFSGTSFSAPQIAGAAALLRQAFPNLTGAQVVDILLRTAREAGAQGTDATYGRGILDIANAFSAQGVTALANSTEPLPLSDTSVVTSPAMGDAGTGTGAATGVEAVVLDSYGRAYQVNLSSTLRGAQLAPRLTNALTGHRTAINLAAGKVAMAFTVDASGNRATLPWSGQLRLSRDDSQLAQVLAARVISQLSHGMRIGFAYHQGADGLTAQLQGRSDPAFLVAGSPLDDYGLTGDAGTAIAVRSQVGRWGVTLRADHANALTASPMALVDGAIERRKAAGVNRFGLSLDRRSGAVGAAFGASWMREDRTILGARLHDALGSRGADSLFLDAAATWQPSARWQIGAQVRRGYTSARLGGTVATGSRLTSTAWAFDVSRSGLFQTSDTLALRVAQPLRVDRGGLTLSLPVAYDYATLSATLGERYLSLAPTGRERSVELAWQGSLWTGELSASAFYRTDPGHYASLPDDTGLALRWFRTF